GGVNGIGGEALPHHADVDTSIRGRERKTRNCLLLSGGIQGDILIQIDVIKVLQSHAIWSSSSGRPVLGIGELDGCLGSRLASNGACQLQFDDTERSKRIPGLPTQWKRDTSQIDQLKSHPEENGQSSELLCCGRPANTANRPVYCVYCSCRNGESARTSSPLPPEIVTSNTSPGSAVTCSGRKGKPGVMTGGRSCGCRDERGTGADQEMV
ncbi:hypothetical protein FQA47_010397, partial [Oryzias melastigma]